jgi:DNA-binding protein HU-beta
MNKAEIIKTVAQSTGQTQKAVGEALEATITVIKDCASKGEEVRLSGLFNMAVTHRPARMVNVPSTGEKQQAPAKNIVKIKAAKELADAANGASSEGK